MNKIAFFDKVKNIDTPFSSYKSSASKLSNNIGKIINALVTDKANGKVYLKTADDITIQMPEEKIKADKGEIVTLEITKTEDNKISLKQINKNYPEYKKSNTKRLNINEIEKILNNSKAISDDGKSCLDRDNIDKEDRVEKALKEKSIKEKSANTIKKIKKQLMYSSKNMTKTAIAELAANGISIDKVDLKILNKVIKEVSTSSGYTENVSHKNNEDDVDQRIKTKLDIIKDLSDSAISYLMKNEKSITVENLYKAQFSSAEKQKDIYDVEGKDINTEDIANVLKKNDIEPTGENIDTASFLIKNEVPITKENIRATRFLRKINEENNYNEILKRIQTAINNGGNPEECILFDYDDGQDIDLVNLKQEYDDILDGIKKISDRHINIAIMQADKINININNLISIAKENNAIDKNDRDNTDKINFLVVKKQLAQIQMKLSWDAMTRLANKNIKIDTLPLQEVIQRLNEAETEKYNDILEVADALPTKDNNNDMINLFNHMKNINPIHNGVLAGIISEKITFTVEAVSNENTRLIEKYGESETIVMPKYGDKFDKIANDIEPLLNNLSVVVNEKNIKSAEILIKNNIEVSPKNIAEVKMILEKINEVYERLNPFIAADMIKNKLNPAQMNIDDVIEYIDKYNTIFGDTPKEKIAKNIADIDSKKILTGDERESVLSIYRMLNHIQSDGGVSIGMAYKANKELTLGNLLDTYRYAKKIRGKENYIDKTIDDNNGLSINSSQDKTSTQKYEEYMLKKFTYKASIKSLQSLVRDYPEYKEITIEDATNKISELDNKILDDEIDEALNKLEWITNTPKNILLFLQENNIPLSINTIEGAREYFKDNRYFKTQINKLASLMKKNDIDIGDVFSSTSSLGLENIDNIYPQFIDKLDDVAKKTEDIEIINGIKEVKKAAQIRYGLNKKDYFLMPLNFGGEMTEIEIHIINGNYKNLDSINTYISLDAGGLGNVKMFLITDKDEVNLNIMADNESLARLKKNKDILLDFIENAGFKAENITFSIAK